MGFAEGFAGGFGMVDAALNRRELMVQREREMATENARYNDSVSRDETRYREGKDRQGQIDKQNADWHNEANARQDKLDQRNEDHYQGEQDFRQQQEKNQTAYQQASLANQRDQIGIHAAQANAQIEMARLQQSYLKEQKAREEATLRAQNLFATDPGSGVTTLNLTPGNELNDLKDIQTAYGVNVMNVARDLPKMQRHVSTVKAALVNPAVFQQNKGAVLEALNEIEGNDINKGLGAYDGTNAELQGGQVVKKEISDIYPSPDGRGFVFNVKTYVEKGGKTYTDEGPMTQYRSSNPADNQIRVIGADQIIQRLDGYDALNKTLASNPQFVNAINSLTAKKGKGEKDHYEKVTSEQVGEDGYTKSKKTLLYNTDKGTVIDPEAKLSDQSDAATLINARKNSGANSGPSLFDAQTAPTNTQSKAPTQAPSMDEARRLVQSPYQRADNR
jgi:hypothetical protein